MKNFAALALFLVALLASTTIVNAQENRSAAVYGIGASGFASGGYNSSNTGTMVGGGIIFKPDSLLGFNVMGLTSTSPTTTSESFRVEGLPANEAPAYTLNQKTRTRLFTGMFQTALGPERSKAKFILMAGPGYLSQATTYSGRVDFEPPGFQFDPSVTSGSSGNFGQFVGVFGAGLSIRLGGWGHFNPGVVYIRPFTNTDQTRSSGYILPFGGVGAGH